MTTGEILTKPANSANARAVPEKPPAIAASEAPATSTTLKRAGTVPTNGVRTYYEVHGQGEPLLILHGGLGSIDMFAPILPALAAKRQVIAVDLLGHGRTELGNRKIDLAEMAEDVATVLKALGIGKLDVFGYSLGGGVAFQFALRHPELVRRLALLSAGFATSGFYAEMRDQQAQVGAAAADFMKETPMYKSYAAVAPKVEDFPRLLQAVGDYMRRDFNFSAEVRQLKVPTLIAFGDSDMYYPEHMVAFNKLLGGGQRDAGWQREHMGQNRLAIIPGATHYDILYAPLLVPTVLQFLSPDGAAKSWDDVVEGR